MTTKTGFTWLVMLLDDVVNALAFIVIAGIVVFVSTWVVLFIITDIYSLPMPIVAMKEIFLTLFFLQIVLCLLVVALYFLQKHHSRKELVNAQNEDVVITK